MPVPAPDRPASAGLIHFAPTFSGFAIGVTEFATMSLVPYISGPSDPVA